MKIIQDIIKSKRNNIYHDPQENVIHHSPEIPKIYPNNKTHSKNGIWIIALISVIALFFALSIFFAGATVNVTPKTYQLDMDSDLVAKKEANAEELPFEIISLNSTESMILQGTNQQNLEKKAKGLVIVYNKFSDKPQKLLINTRILSTSGQIYKTDNAIIIPGYTVKNNEIIPGSIEVSITADAVGQIGNSEMTDFTIPGFKGGPKFDKFFVRSKTSISGGVKGLVYSLSEEEALLTRLYHLFE